MLGLRRVCYVSLSTINIPTYAVFTIRYLGWLLFITVHACILFLHIEKERRCRLSNRILSSKSSCKKLREKGRPPADNAEIKGWTVWRFKIWPQRPVQVLAFECLLCDLANWSSIAFLELYCFLCGRQKLEQSQMFLCFLCVSERKGAQSCSSELFI